jgi:hypothetical protein
MSTTSNSTPRTPEEIRREMKSRFDAVNTAAEDRHQQRRDAGDAAASEENKRWVRPEDNAGINSDNKDVRELG